MGKLGGAELNYASDVDVLFVHDGDGAEADRVARALLSTMTTPTPDGIVFRTDADLRPEGRAGSLSRNLDSYDVVVRALGAHVGVPGAPEGASGRRRRRSGRALHRSDAPPFVWPERLDPDAVREVRAMKARAEAELQTQGAHGSGAQAWSRRDPRHRVRGAAAPARARSPRRGASVRRTTLDALDQLADRGLHRDGRRRAARRRVHVPPHGGAPSPALGRAADAHAAGRRGRRSCASLACSGTATRPRQTAVEAFEADQRAHQAAVRSIHERLFFAPVLDTLAGAGPLPIDAVEERLAAFGFVDATHTRAALRELTQGLTRQLARSCSSSCR